MTRRGGPRPGAGRPITTGRRPRIWGTVTDELIARVDAVRDRGESTSELVAAAVGAEVERREREREEET